MIDDMGYIRFTEGLWGPERDASPFTEPGTELQGVAEMLDFIIA